MTHDNTTTADNADTRNPAAIEREIRRTQAEMSRTADRIGEQMTPRNLFDALLDKADQSGIDARYVLDQARRNPIALGMIAIGGLWLVSDSDARAKNLTDKLGHESAPGDEWDHAHDHGYVRHMAGIEPRADEEHDAYRRRRDCARASYLMIEQRHDEDESSFRKRLDEATDSLREQRDNVARKAREWSDGTRRSASRFSDRAGRFYEENPLIGGLAAAFAGAIAGAAFPATRLEEEYLGDTAESAIDTAREKATAKKSELVDKADAKLNEAGSSPDRSHPGQTQARSFETT